ncbi:hypothetical protein RF11_12288 [Thelohanellus kitauei]|uniref:Daxx histone-binding domain-containing protein n=1 Tax=Thelohanellus kitauei TaxID=669202 RepID=A0A0C2IGW1_THEKT|nr:hypothetical protein RF11_12288 [Thelohanellus kitauei]
MELNSDDDFIEADSPKHDDTVRLGKLENQLQQLEKIILKYNECEMTVEEMDSDQSYYIKQDLIIKKYMELWKQYRNATQPNINNSKLFHNLIITKSKENQINNKIKFYLSKKQRFPDYSEIRKIVNKCSNKFQLNMTQSMIDFESVEIFSEICKQLKTRRQNDLKENIQLLTNKKFFLSYEDPADSEAELNAKLSKIINEQKKQVENIISEFSRKCQEEIDK